MTKVGAALPAPLPAGGRAGGHGWVASGEGRGVHVPSWDYRGRGRLLGCGTGARAVSAPVRLHSVGPLGRPPEAAGELIQLRDAGGNLVDEVRYEAGFPWPTAAAGAGLPTSTGFSAELINPALDRNLGGSWRSSLPAPVPPAPYPIYIPTNSFSWHYRKGTNEASSPVSAWRQRGFVEDETWSIGQTSIGFGDNDDNTILSDMRSNYVSVFLR